MLMTFNPAINGWAIFSEVGRTACRVLAKRLRDVRGFVVRDLPWTVEKLRILPPFEFENWAVITLGGMGVAASGRASPFAPVPFTSSGFTP